MVLFIQGYPSLHCINVMLYELIDNMKQKYLREPLRSCWETQPKVYYDKAIFFPKKFFITPRS